jgi:hypothetical protein
MIEECLEIPTLGAEVFLYRPDRLAEYPGLVFITDVWGVRPATVGMAKRLAEKGFAVLLPNAFHRYSRNRPDGFWVEDEAAQNRALHELFAALPPATLQFLLEPANQAVLADVLQYHVLATEVFAADIRLGRAVEPALGAEALHPAQVVADGGVLQHRQGQRQVAAKHLPALLARLLERQWRQVRGVSLEVGIEDMAHGGVVRRGAV